MSELIKIAVDAMGGDNSPKKIIDGIILNHNSNKNVFYKIFGDKKIISELVNNKISKNYYEIIHWTIEWNELFHLNSASLHKSILNHPLR